MDKETEKIIDNLKKESDEELIAKSYSREPWEVDLKERGFDYTSLYQNEMARRLKNEIKKLNKTTSFYSKILIFLTIIMTITVLVQVWIFLNN